MAVLSAAIMSVLPQLGGRGGDSLGLVVGSLKEAGTEIFGFVNTKYNVY
jgi:hypothetical protein